MDGKRVVNFSFQSSFSSSSLSVYLFLSFLLFLFIYLSRLLILFILSSGSIRPAPHTVCSFSFYISFKFRASFTSLQLRQWTKQTTHVVNNDVQVKVKSLSSELLFLFRQKIQKSWAKPNQLARLNNIIVSALNIICLSFLMISSVTDAEHNLN